jgi:ribosome-associated protein
MEPKQLATQIAHILDQKKATRVKVLRVHDLTVMADYFVIASGTSSTHVRSLSEEVEFQLKEAGVEPLRTEGFNTQNWFILDYGSVIVHVFSPDARDFYDLDHLWADGEEVPMNFVEE